MYEFNSRIRYSEVDADGKLTLEGIMNYMQDCSTFQSEDLGVGIEYLTQNNLVWVLTSWQIEILEYPKLCQHVIIGTIPYDIKKSLGFRNFYIKDKEGRYFVKANSYWMLLDLKSMKPVSANSEMLHAYKLEEKLEMQDKGRKIRTGPNGIEKEPFFVTKRNIDTNHHVNNVQYVVMAMEFLNSAKDIGSIRTEYCNQARLGDQILPKHFEQDDHQVIELLNALDRSLFARIEFNLK